MFPSHFMFAGQVTENNCSSSTDRTTRTRFPTKSSIKEHNNFQLRGRSFYFPDNMRVGRSNFGLDSSSAPVMDGD